MMLSFLTRNSQKILIGKRNNFEHQEVSENNNSALSRNTVWSGWNCPQNLVQLSDILLGFLTFLASISSSCSYNKQGLIWQTNVETHVVHFSKLIVNCHTKIIITTEFVSDLCLHFLILLNSYHFSIVRSSLIPRYSGNVRRTSAVLFYQI
jgi:hypothetical protein